MSLSRLPKIAEKYPTNRYLNKVLPKFIDLYKIILRSINDPNYPQNPLLVPYEELIKYNTTVMGLSLTKQIERYNKITIKINDFIKIINNQIYRLIKNKDKYIKGTEKDLPEKKERLLTKFFLLVKIINHIVLMEKLLFLVHLLVKK